MVMLFGIIDFPVTELLLFFNIVLFVFLALLTIQLRRLNRVKEELYDEVRDLRGVLHEYIKSDVTLWAVQQLQAGMKASQLEAALSSEGYKNASDIVEKAQDLLKARGK